MIKQRICFLTMYRRLICGRGPQPYAALLLSSSYSMFFMHWRENKGQHASVSRGPWMLPQVRQSTMGDKTPQFALCSYRWAGLTTDSFCFLHELQVCNIHNSLPSHSSDSTDKHNLWISIFGFWCITSPFCLMQCLKNYIYISADLVKDSACYLSVQDSDLWDEWKPNVLKNQLQFFPMDLW